MLKLFLFVMILCQCIYGAMTDEEYNDLIQKRSRAKVELTDYKGTIRSYKLNKTYGHPGNPNASRVSILLDECNKTWQSIRTYQCIFSAILNPINITPTQYADCIWRIAAAMDDLPPFGGLIDTYHKIVNAYVDHMIKNHNIPNADYAVYDSTDADWWPSGHPLSNASPITKIFFKKVEGQLYVIPFKGVQIGELNQQCFNFIHPDPENPAIARRFVYGVHGIINQDVLDIRMERSGALPGIRPNTPGLIIKTVFGANASIPFSALVHDITYNGGQNPTGRPSQHVHLPGSQLFEAAVRAGLPDGEHLWPLINEEREPLNALMAEIMLIRKLQEKAHQEKISNLRQAEEHGRRTEKYRENQARTTIVTQWESSLQSIPQTDSSEIIDMPDQGIQHELLSETATQAWEAFARTKWGHITEDERNTLIQAMEYDLHMRATQEALRQQALADQAIREQESISRRVANGEKHNKKSRATHKKLEPAPQNNAATPVIPPATDQALKRAEEAAKRFFEQGRVKYDAVVSLMAALWQSLPEESLARIAQNTNGSHITFHDTESGTTPLTIVRHHGSEDDTIPWRRAAHLVTSTMNFLKATL